MFLTEMKLFPALNYKEKEVSLGDLNLPAILHVRGSFGSAGPLSEAARREGRETKGP